MKTCEWCPTTIYKLIRNKLSHDVVLVLHNLTYVKKHKLDKELIKGELKMNIWLQRISHYHEVSERLLEQKYLTIGFSDYVKKYEEYADDKMIQKISKKTWRFYIPRISDRVLI